MMPKHVIITHIDGDGVCAAALCIQGLQQRNIPLKNIKTIFTQPYKLYDLLELLISEQDVSELHVYILDLSSKKNILPLVQQFKTAVYIDHHPLSLQLKDSGLEGLIDQYRSCSQLVVDYFDMDHTLLVTLGTACDKLLLIHRSDPMWKETELLRTALMFNIDNPGFRYNLIDKLVDGKLPSEIKEVEDYSFKNNQRIAHFMKLANKNILIDNDKCIIIHTGTENAKGYGGIVATKLAINKVKPVFILSKDNRENIIVITSRNHRNNTIDLSKVMNEFGGGGHAMAAGGIMVGDYTYKDVAVRIVNVLKNQGGV